MRVHRAFGTVIRPAICLSIALIVQTAVLRAQTPSFRDDVLPILKAHCFQCHGNGVLKNDFDARTRDGLLKGGRTGTAIRPGSLRDSLLWQFIATDKMPANDDKLSDAQKDLLRRWIVAGAPLAGSTKVEAKSDMPPTGEKRGVTATAKVIDEAVARKLAEAHVPPSPRADDAEFLRRVYLDLTGKVPTLETAVAFLDSRDSDKRRKLIDELLASDDYGRHFAVIWHKLMIAKTSENYRRVHHDRFKAWLADSFNQGRGWDRIVYDLLTAEGQIPQGGNQKPRASTYPEKPEAAYLFSHELDKRIQPKLIAASSSRLFLAQSIDCAQCHNHPLAKWRRSDFWGVAAFFDRIRVEGKEVILKEPSTGKEIVFENKGADRRYVIPAIQPKPVIDMEDSSETRTGKFVSARFLDGDVLAESTAGPYRPIYAEWATAPQNPFFARAAVNRWWGHLLGRSFVEPVDDMSEDNPPSHPELLNALSTEFVASGFDLKHLIRCICNSQTYQRSSVPLKENLTDSTLYSRQSPKQMTAEVLYECLLVIAPKFEQADKKTKDPSRFRDEFLTVLDSGEGSATEFSRGLQQALRLMNGDGKAFGKEALARIIRTDAMADENVERIYLSVLSRRPTASERERMLDYVNRSAETADRLGDVFWALLNSGEFIINH